MGIEIEQLSDMNSTACTGQIATIIVSEFASMLLVQK